MDIVNLSIYLSLRLLSLLVAPAILYSCELGGSQLQSRLDADARNLQGVQSAFLRNLCGRFPVGIPMPAIFKEVAQDLCTLSWWVSLCVLELSVMPSWSLHREILGYNVLNAFAKPSDGNWAVQVINDHFLIIG